MVYVRTPDCGIRYQNVIEESVLVGFLVADINRIVHKLHYSDKGESTGKNLVLATTILSNDLIISVLL